MRSTRRRFLARTARTLLLLLGAPLLARARESARAIHTATRNTLTGAIGVGLRRLFAGDPERAHGHEGRPRISLPDVRTTPVLPLADALERYVPAAGFAGTALPGATLARLLHFTNGVTGRSGGIALRAAPSAGALYAGEVYVVAERVEGLPPGVHAFLPLEGRLARLDAGPRLAEVTAALEDPARGRGAACAVLLTNVFGRYRARYANRGYRYALLDSGHQGENLRLAATSTGLAEWGPLRFHDARLNALLGIDGVEEAVCAVHLVGERGAAPGEAETQRLVEAARAGHALPEEADDAPERYHAATALVPDGEEERDRTGGAPAARTDPFGQPVALPVARIPSTSVEEAIAKRRSTRVFRDAPVAAPDLRFALAAAIGHPALVRVPGVELRLFVHHVEGVPPGLYRANPDARHLEPLRPGRLDEPLVDACLGQEKAGEAAVAFAMVGDLAGATARGGERAYRDLCLEAGGIGQRLYLAAEALGLTARNLAAFVDDRLNDLARVDGRDRAVLHLTLLGVGD